MCPSKHQVLLYLATNGPPWFVEWICRLMKKTWGCWKWKGFYKGTHLRAPRLRCDRMRQFPARTLGCSMTIFQGVHWAAKRKWTREWAARENFAPADRQNHKLGRNSCDACVIGSEATRMMWVGGCTCGHSPRSMRIKRANYHLLLRRVECTETQVSVFLSASQSKPIQLNTWSTKN